MGVGTLLTVECTFLIDFTLVSSDLVSMHMYSVSKSCTWSDKHFSGFFIFRVYLEIIL